MKFPETFRDSRKAVAMVLEFLYLFESPHTTDRETKIAKSKFCRQYSETRPYTSPNI